LKVAIVGGGLAGCALAHILDFVGAEPVIFEKGPSLASGASGNSIGLYNPRFTAERTPQSDYYASAFSAVLRRFSKLEDVDWNPSGALHLINDEKKKKRFYQTVDSWGWMPETMNIVDADAASEIAGVELRHEAMYLPQSGSVSPVKLCRAYTAGVDFHLNAPDEAWRDINADAVVLACGPAVREYLPDLPIGTVRGQITEVEASEKSSEIKTAICYGGYMSAPVNDMHIVGSTFQRWLDHSDLIEQDDVDNMNKMAAHISGMEEGLNIIGSRASVRATSQDHFPIVGKAPANDLGIDNLYVSAAHGSHGILSTFMAAKLLTDMITDRPYSLSMDTVSALSPGRF